MQRPPPRRTAPPGRRTLTLAASSVLLLVMGRADVSGQSAAIMPPTPRPAVPLPALEASPPTLALLPEAVGTPHLSWDTPTEIWLLSYPLKLSVTRALVAEPVRLLPPSGLHAGDIRWSFDRGYVGTADPAAPTAR